MVERGGFEPPRVLSLPVFEFESIPSAGVHDEQSYTIVSPPKAIPSANIPPLGGQGGGQPRAHRRADEIVVATAAPIPRGASGTAAKLSDPRSEARRPVDAAWTRDPLLTDSNGAGKVC